MECQDIHRIILKNYYETNRIGIKDYIENFVHETSKKHSFVNCFINKSEINSLCYQLIHFISADFNNSNIRRIMQ